MKKLAEIRSQESLCRERAAFDTERKAFWLAQAEKWEQRALDEIAFHFRECNPEHQGAPSPDGAARTVSKEFWSDDRVSRAY